MPAATLIESSGSEGRKGEWAVLLGNKVWFNWSLVMGISGACGGRSRVETEGVQPRHWRAWALLSRALSGTRTAVSEIPQNPRKSCCLACACCTFKFASAGFL